MLRRTLMRVKQPRRAVYAAQTQRALLRAARTLFVARGYAHTPIAEVVRRARVTRGALYHHFTDKRALFEGVFEEVQREQLERVSTATVGLQDPWDRFLAGTAAYLDNCLRPDVQRIVLIEGPSVLGWATWRETDIRYARGALHTALEHLIAEKIIHPYPPDLLTHFLVGAFTEAGLAIAKADNKKASRAQAGRLMKTVLKSLRR